MPQKKHGNTKTSNSSFVLFRCTYSQKVNGLERCPVVFCVQPATSVLFDGSGNAKAVWNFPSGTAHMHPCFWMLFDFALSFIRNELIFTETKYLSSQPQRTSLMSLYVFAADNHGSVKVLASNPDKEYHIFSAKREPCGELIQNLHRKSAKQKVDKSFCRSQFSETFTRTSGFFIYFSIIFGGMS